MPFLKDFKEKFSKSITLRNELRPIGKTLEHIKQECIIEKDEKRNSDYKQAKKIIDNFHREFIDKALSKSTVDWTDYEQAIRESALAPEDDKDAVAKRLVKVQENKRKEIAKLFTGFEFGVNPDKNSEILKFEDLFKENLFKYLIKPSLNENEAKIIDSFDRFTTYFKGFHENRKNMYSSDEKSTSIAYRAVHENFPKFLANIAVFNQWLVLCPQCIDDAENELKKAGVIDENYSLRDAFSVSSYNRFLTQEGIDEYNRLLGGIPADAERVKIKGLNEFVNLAAQKDSNLRDNLKKKRSLKMSVLYKQILSDRVHSFIDAFDNDGSAIDAIKSLYQNVLSEGGAVKVLTNLICDLKEYDLTKILVNGKNINNLSKDLFGGQQWSLLRNSICESKKDEKDFKKNIKDTSTSDEIDKFLSKSDYSLEYLSSVAATDICSKIKETITEKLKSIVEVNDFDWPEDLKSEGNKEKVKTILDTLLSIYQFMKNFSTSSFDKDQNFYSDFDVNLQELSLVVSLYNKVRNYATQKPYSLEKFKLNFENPQLADGWSETKEADYMSVLFVKDNNYYLGIFNKQKKPNFSKGINKTSKDPYKKMRYIQFKDFSKMLPKCSFTNEVKKHFNSSDSDYLLSNDNFIKPLRITKEIFELNCGVAKGSVKKFQKAYRAIDENAYKQALKTWIQFGKEFLEAYKTTSQFDLNLLKTADQYVELTDFYSEVDNLAYKLDFVDIDSAFIDNLVAEGSLYLFQIYNKDFAKGASGTKNLHTLYLESIFSKENAKAGVVKLNGYAELFFRLSSLVKTTVHKEGSYLVNKSYYDKFSGSYKQIPGELFEEIYKFANKQIGEDKLSTDAKNLLPVVTIKKATHEIKKDKRFTEDKFFFHCPITINYKAADKVSKFNDKVLDFLQNNKDINIIGIDRGERNLIYATVINQKGEILECKSFNNVNHNSSERNVEVDYLSKLQNREYERDKARKSWNSVSKIATLKEGYLSTVIHELSKLMIKHNAIIVLENLNMGFKRVRGGIAERSVYQKFEKMLIDKLNYLVDKSADCNAPGGVLNGYQLTSKFTSFKDISGQTGFLFYVPAAYTSKIDPATGFVNAFNFRDVKNAEEQKKFFNSFDSISYVAEEDLFKFSTDFSKFRISCDIAIKKWDIYSYGDRIVREKNDKGIFVQNRKSPTEELKSLFSKYNIDFTSENLKKLILSSDKTDKSFWKKLFYIFSSILQMRNSMSGTMEDYLVSPVKDKDGRFFDSNNLSGSKFEKIADADANGAYHIALKGLLMLQKNDSLGGKDARKTTSKEWFEFVQKKMKQ